MHSRHHSYHHDVTWQQAVYVRKHARDIYTFSHAATTKLKKSFPSSLSIPCLFSAPGLKAANLNQLRNAPVLILVTGDWAVHLSIEDYQGIQESKDCKSSKFDLDRLPKSRYDHLDRLGHLDTAECAELTDDHRALKYHCTAATYEAGDDHSWRISSVSPILSDIVILPRILEETRLKAVMSSFCRATRKSLRDSILLAGGERVREEMLCCK